MSAVTWGVCSKDRTATVFCMACRAVLNLHVPLVEALEFKRAAQDAHTCPPPTDCN